MVSHFFRRYQQPMMIVVTFLIIIVFVFFFNGNFMNERPGGPGNAGTIYGRTVTDVDAQREGRRYELAARANLQDLSALLLPAQSQQEAEENFLWNSYVLSHEAQALGISVPDAEVGTAIQQLPSFQTNGSFDPKIYGAFIDNVAKPRGMMAKQFEDLVRDMLTVRKITALLSSTTAPAESRVRAAYNERHQRYEPSVIRLAKADFLAAATAPDDEVAKLYETRKAQLKSEEMRSVRYVAFILPTTDTPLEGKARAAEMGKLGKAAEEFSIAMTEKDADFAAAAAKAGVKVEQTGDFTRFAPPAALASVPALANVAFKLTPKEPTSDPVMTERGYYVVQLAGITEARPLTLEEAKPQLVEQIKDERAQEALELKAKELHAKLDAELKAGKPLAEAAQAAGAKVESFPAFSLSEPPRDPLPDARAVVMAAIGLKAGQLSEFTPTPAGGAFVFLDKLPPVDDTKFAAEKAMLAGAIAQFEGQVLFAEWLKTRRAEAKITPARRRG
jgi:peptidyl-prolyl cis-trans isomerase D